jgi:hypothetical protein
MADERRGRERLAILGRLPGGIMVFAPMAIQELGIDGAAIETTFPLHLNAVHDLRLTLGSGSVVLKARVVHSRVTDVEQEAVVYRTGLEFIDVSARVTAALAEYLADVQKQRTA